MRIGKFEAHFSDGEGFAMLFVTIIVVFVFGIFAAVLISNAQEMKKVDHCLEFHKLEMCEYVFGNLEV